MKWPELTFGLKLNTLNLHYFQCRLSEPDVSSPVQLTPEKKIIVSENENFNRHRQGMAHQMLLAYCQVPLKGARKQREKAFCTSESQRKK